MNHLNMQKKTDTHYIHPLARRLSAASHCSHSTLNPNPLMAVTARKSWCVLPEHLLTCLTDLRQLPLLPWRNGIRFLAVVNHMPLENPLSLLLLQPLLDSLPLLLERIPGIPPSLLGCNRRTSQPVHEPTNGGPARLHGVVVIKISNHGVVLASVALHQYQVRRQRKSSMSMRARCLPMVSCIRIPCLHRRLPPRSQRPSRMWHMRQRRPPRHAATP